MLGDDADWHPVALIRACITILDEEILPLQVSAEALFDPLEFFRFNGPIHLAPADLAFAGGLAHEELVLGQASRELPGAHDERSEMAQGALVAPDGFFVKGRRWQVPMNIAEVFETEMFQAVEFVKSSGVHGFVFSGIQSITQKLDNRGPSPLAPPRQAIGASLETGRTAPNHFPESSCG